MKFLNINMMISLIILAYPALAEPPTIILPLVKLIVDPEPYVGARVEVIGYLAEPGLQIFLTKDHAMMSDFSSSIFVSDTDTGEITFSECMSRYVKITGNLAKTEHNNLIITNVTKIRTDGYKICWER